MNIWHQRVRRKTSTPAITTNKVRSWSPARHRTENMAVDVLSRLTSAKLHYTNLHEEIHIYYVQFVNNIFITGEREDTNDNAKPPKEVYRPGPATNGLFLEQRNDTLCCENHTKLDENDIRHLLEQHEILANWSQLDGPIQQTIPTKLHKAILYHTHCPRLAGHPGGRRTYNIVQRSYCQPHTVPEFSRALTTSLRELVKWKLNFNTNWTRRMRTVCRIQA